MGVGIDLLLDELYNIEILMSDLYNFFKKIFPDDADFWWTLSQEELNHASLLSSVKETFIPIGKYPSFIDDVTFDSAFNEGQRLKNTIEYVKSTAIEREEAFNLAFSLENSVMEEHYQNFMNAANSNNVDKVFQKLNSFDKDHAERVKNRAKDVGIQIKF